MANYQDLIYMLTDYGFTDVLLPFLLIFTIIYAVLQKSQIFGEGKKNFNVVIALIIGLSVVIPHTTGSYAAGFDAVDIINAALPSISILAVAFISFLILIGVFGAETKWIGASLSGWMAIVSFIAVAVTFASAAGWMGSFSIYDWIDSDTITLFIIILVFGVIVSYITSEPGKGVKGAQLTSALDGIGKYFGGK